MLVLYATPRDIDLGDLRVDVDYDADTTPRQVEIAVQLPDHLTKDQVKRLEKRRRDLPGAPGAGNRLHVQGTTRNDPVSDARGHLDPPDPDPDLEQ